MGARMSEHADALLRLAQAQDAGPPQYSPLSWESYGGSQAILLAILLLVVAAGFAYAGRRLRAPLMVARPGGAAAGLMIAIWLLAIYNLGIATFVYGLQVRQEYPNFIGRHPH